MIRELQSRLEGLRSLLAKVRSVNVNVESLKAEAIEIGSFYFKECREYIVQFCSDQTFLTDYDSAWQSLIRLAHGNNSKKSYTKLVTGLIKLTKEISVLNSVSRVNPLRTAVATATNQESQLIITLATSIPSAAASYKQALSDLSQSTPRVSYRGTASELREALREVLDHFAPDGVVEKQSWYKPEGKQTKPTMKQKVKFILKSRGRNDTMRVAAEKSTELIEELSGQLARSVYDRASLSTHSVTQKSEVEQIKRYVDTVLFDLLEVKGK